MTELELPRCEHCGKPFVPRGARQQYCKRSCQQMAFMRRKREGEKAGGKH